MSSESRNLYIAGTQSSPEIAADWDAGLLVMKGDSYPENTFELFERVIQWVETFLANGERPLRLDLYLVYLNTSSVRAMIDILELLETAHAANQDVGLRWFYDYRNQRVAELAEEFREDYTLPFEILPFGE
ncbi:MAG: biofilm regulation phosphoprotein SiaC [Gammaproteobacteria bacterium]